MTIVARTLRCFCQCHAMADDTAWKYGVDSRSHVACIGACNKCRVNHEPALYSDDPPSAPLPEPDPPAPADATGGSEGSE